MSQEAGTVSRVAGLWNQGRFALPPVLPDVIVHLSPQVFLLIEPLPVCLRPARVTRYDDVTAVVVDPETLCAELAFWFPENLTPEEHLALRVAYGVDVPLDQPPPDSILDGRLSERPVPLMLRPPRERMAESA